MVNVRNTIDREASKLPKLSRLHASDEASGVINVF